MSYSAVSSGVNIVTIEKDGSFKAMACAWASMVDFDKVVMLIGSQSETGSVIKKGDIIGFSALSSNQADIAEKIWSVHSSRVDKKSIASFEKLDKAYVVQDARTQNELEVIDVLHLEGIEEDNLVYARIITYKDDKDLGFYRYP